MKDVRVLYPSFVTKAVTFSMDDGRVEQDEALIRLLGPRGFRGTFNLPRVDMLTPNEYRELYRGFEIANHCKNHPYAFDDDVRYSISGDAFDPERSDGSFIYEHPEKPGFYYFRRSVGWRLITDPDTYISCIKASHEELEAIFGVGSVRGYAWPFYEQNSARIRDYLASSGYTNVRGSGLVGDQTNFELPQNPMSWKCNANHTNLGEMMARYDALADDGGLKFFAFGVHASDYLRGEAWDMLVGFAEKYGDRQDDFWYATVGEIFNYREAALSLRREGSVLTNTGNTELYLVIHGENVILGGGERLSL